ncbi:DUF6153 family protein [Actinomadura formosensis]|uniref:DUF6153 family protein n=1 Tax=Actinomadura formosensis TaxID=60706 RepID=UPI0008303D4F|nr:DUF6153 family protein [Actinomadura formosensis]
MGRLRTRPERWGRGRAPTPLFGLVLFFGVLAMHGFQASPDPADMTGVPMTSMSAARPMPEASAHHHSGGGRQPADHQRDHPGGQVCLAMLTALSLFGAVIALYRRRAPATVARLLAMGRLLVAGRPPPRPALHELSVLRL